MVHPLRIIILLSEYFATDLLDGLVELEVVSHPHIQPNHRSVVPDMSRVEVVRVGAEAFDRPHGSRRKLDLHIHSPLLHIDDRSLQPFTIRREMTVKLSRNPRSEERRVGKECRSRWAP